MTGRLIVLSGEAGSGKDSFAKILVEQHGWRTFSLAAPMKRFAKDLFGFTDEQLYGKSSSRNEPDPRWVHHCIHCDENGNQRLMEIYGVRACEACGGTRVINDNSARSVLQNLAEHLRNTVHPDVLTMRARPEVEDILACGNDVVITDARYHNDRNNLREWLSARLVDIVSIRKLNDEELAKRDAQVWRNHTSEMQRPSAEILDAVVEHADEWPFASLPGHVELVLRTLWSA